MEVVAILVDNREGTKQAGIELVVCSLVLLASFAVMIKKEIFEKEQGVKHDAVGLGVYVHYMLDSLLIMKYQMGLYVGKEVTRVFVATARDRVISGKVDERVKQVSTHEDEKEENNVTSTGCQLFSPPPM